MTDATGMSEVRVAEIRVLAQRLKDEYGELYLQETYLIDGCLELLASHTALAARLKAAQGLLAKHDTDADFWHKEACEKHERLKACEAEKADMVLRNKLLRNRPDVPIERLEAYDAITKENTRLKAVLERALFLESRKDTLSPCTDEEAAEWVKQAHAALVTEPPQC